MRDGTEPVADGEFLYRRPVHFRRKSRGEAADNARRKVVSRTNHPIAIEALPNNSEPSEFATKMDQLANSLVALRYYGAIACARHKRVRHFATVPAGPGELPGFASHHIRSRYFQD